MKNFKNHRTFGEKTMHKTTCSKCGGACEVPFKPNGKKPVFCTNCFIPGSSTNSVSTGITKEQFDILNTKLDSILNALGTKKEKTDETPQPVKKAWSRLKYKK